MYIFRFVSQAGKFRASKWEALLFSAIKRGVSMPDDTQTLDTPGPDLQPDTVYLPYQITGHNVSTDTVYLPSVDLTIQYSITAGDLLLSVLLAALIAVISIKWFYQVIFRRGD